MKKFKNNFAYGAALLVGAMTFSACSSDDEVVDVNPSFDGKNVKTQFAINIPYADGVKTRMSGTNTQATKNDFLGMYDIKLVPMNTSESTTALTSILSLTELSTKPGGTEATSWSGEGFRKIYSDVNVAVNTNQFLFYAAGRDAATAPSTDADKFAKGILNANVAGTVTTDISFALVPAKEATIAQAIRTAITNLDNNTDFDLTDGKFTTTLTYPRNINMPDGAAAVKCDNGTFTAQTGSVLPVTTVQMKDICFPASIYYFVNTPLYATNASEVTWPGTLATWAEATFSGWQNSVSASTRTIALKNPIQYGVAKLNTTVKCETSSLEDSKGTMISVPTGGFKVTAVLVGGQPVNTKWDFNPDGAPATAWTNVVYDSDVKGIFATIGGSNVNHTLVMDNSIWTSAETPERDASQQEVSVVIELENGTASDFFGHDNQIIPAGGKFYLIAKLNPSGKTVTPSVTNPSVFMQDYETTAKLTIKSLKEAYNVIPDLRASQMQLGLAVDLEWQKGIEFSVDIQ